MAEKNDSASAVKEKRGILNRFRTSLKGPDQIIDDLNLSLYGSKPSEDADKLNNRFNEIMNREISNISGGGANDYSSFLGSIFASDKENKRAARIIGEELDFDGRGSALNPAQFINDRYKNQMLKQADAHQIANQLVELKEAKNTMRDAILSPDVNTGRINRDIVFEKSTISDAEKDYKPIVEKMEDHFDLKKKIKDFIVDNTLDYGEFYVYTIPYHEIFQNFADKYKGQIKNIRGQNFFEAADDSVEDIIFHSICESGDEVVDKRGVDLTPYVEDVNSVLGYDTSDKRYAQINDDLETLLTTDRFTVSTSSVPIPILENSVEALQELHRDHPGAYFTENWEPNQKDGGEMQTDVDTFLRKYKGSEEYSDDGFYGRKSDKKDGEEFEPIKDCYIKMIDPTHLIPVEIMGNVMFYIYIQTDDAAPLSTILSYQSVLKTKDPSDHIDNLVETIATQIVSKFDQKFVTENKDFRKLIVSALQYYELGNTKVHFQVIPKKYITPFKINVDEAGRGHSMLEDSLFYAKLYLMLLMFKIVTIITKSNDQEINYLRTSGIDKNVFNKAQEIARRKQARRITINDMFSYTGIINKIAGGSAIYMPLGKNGEKPIETEILQGQSVELNNDLMEMLRNNYILASGVPAAIINYLNEADFAKSIENANTKMNGRVINFQIDLNSGLTDLYKKLLRFATDVPEEVIQTVKIVLPKPKGNSNITTGELINNYTTMQEFLVKLYFGESPDDDLHLKAFLKEVAKMHLGMINFTEIDTIFKNTKAQAMEKKINPSNDDDGMSFE